MWFWHVLPRGWALKNITKQKKPDMTHIHTRFQSHEIFRIDKSVETESRQKWCPGPGGGLWTVTADGAGILGGGQAF